MSSKIILLVLGALAVAGLVWYMVVGPSEAVLEVDESAEQQDIYTGESSIAALLARGEAMECSFTFITEDGETGEGIGFFAGEQMRVDSSYTADGVNYTVSYIYSEPQMYAWGEAPEGSFAVSIPTHYDDLVGDEETEWADTEVAAPVDIDDEVTYVCQPWAVDASMFIPPSSVQFMDMGMMMQGMMGEMDQEYIEEMMRQMEEAGLVP